MHARRARQPVRSGEHTSPCFSSVGEARVGFVVRWKGLLLQALQQPLQVVQEHVGGVPAIAVPYHHPQRDKIFPVLGKRVSGHLPAALAHPPRDVVGRVPIHLVPKLEGEDGKLRAVGYELKGTELRDGGGGVGRYVPALLLDAPVALEAQPEEVVVLRHDLRARTREVQGEGGHVSSQVVYPEDEVFGQASGSRQMAQPTPGYTLPYLWPEVLIEATRGRRKSHTKSGSRKGAIMPPDAPSTWIGTSRPVRSCSSSKASEISATGS